MAEAILNRFVENGTYGVITTHYQNLKHFADSTESVVNGAMLYDRAQMQPLFLLRIGHPGSSFAIEIARKIGLPEDVIAYAADLVGKDYVMSDKYLQDIARDKMYWETKRQKVHTQEKQLQASLANYEKELQNFNQERKQVMAKAKEEAQDLLKQSNAKIESTIRASKEAQAEKEKTREVRQQLDEYKNALRQDVEEEDRIARKIEKIKRRQQRKSEKKGSALQQLVSTLSKNASDQPQAAPTQVKVRVGDYVRLKGQTTVGHVEVITGKQARVLFGMMHTNVPLSRLEVTVKPESNNISKVSTFVSKQTRDAVYEKKLNFKSEIDLRGMRGDEALDVVSHFIDDAILLEQSQVRILHGTGTGALRALVRQYLQTVPGVKSFHDEHVQFGGAGITIVEF